MRLLLIESGLDILATQNEKYEFVIAIAKGNYQFVILLNGLIKKSEKKQLATTKHIANSGVLPERGISITH